MGQPAARIGDMHTCPMSDGPKPHVGGPILPPGAINVLIGGQPAARVTDFAMCVGPPDRIFRGSATVLIGGLMAARMGDNTAHGGVIVQGFPKVLIGEAAGAVNGIESPIGYPGDDPSRCPEGWIASTNAVGKPYYESPDRTKSLSPDLDNPKEGPHWDYNDRLRKPRNWRIWPNGKMTPK
jgi:uncharacterized Zn-binding protein involved in type VI secretion